VEKSIEQIQTEALKELESASDPNVVKTISVRYLGRKGKVTQLLRSISSLPPEKRAATGQKANALKKALEKTFEDSLKRFETETAEAKDRIDVSLPGRPAVAGSLHVLTQVNQQICDIFAKMGFDIAEGPEVETDYYNFEALNFPKDHPARDMQDTFFVSDNIVGKTNATGKNYYARQGLPV
jgi:phenylalanyl-tRNA synthetase alpha chain